VTGDIPCRCLPKAFQRGQGQLAAVHVNVALDGSHGGEPSRLTYLLRPVSGGVHPTQPVACVRSSRRCCRMGCRSPTLRSDSATGTRAESIMVMGQRQGAFPCKRRI